MLGTGMAFTQRREAAATSRTAVSQSMGSKLPSSRWRSGWVIRSGPFLVVIEPARLLAQVAPRRRVRLVAARAHDMAPVVAAELHLDAAVALAEYAGGLLPVIAHRVGLLRRAARVGSWVWGRRRRQQTRVFRTTVAHGCCRNAETERG